MRLVNGAVSLLEMHEAGILEDFLKFSAGLQGVLALEVALRREPKDLDEPAWPLGREAGSEDGQERQVAPGIVCGIAGHVAAEE
jgi:hypothetical protein